MKQLAKVVALALGCAACFASPALSQTPSPAHSTAPHFVAAAPDGSIEMQLVLRDAADVPVPHHVVAVYFPDCTALATCAGGGLCTGCSGTGLVWSIETDANGVARFAPRLGASTCAAPAHIVFYDEFWVYRTAPLATLDRDGDLVVTLADLALVHAALGTSDASADFDGDGVVTTADEAILQAHMGAGCDGATGVRPRTWGSLKTLYR